MKTKLERLQELLEKDITKDNQKETTEFLVAYMKVLTTQKKYREEHEPQSKKEKRIQYIQNQRKKNPEQYKTKQAEYRKKRKENKWK